jgi:DNA polymerase V
MEGGLAGYGDEMKQRIADWLGLAVCVGIGSSKTLAKLANHCAKKNLAGSNGVCDFTTMAPATLTELFQRIEVGEVWGIGRKISARLEAMGINTVRQLRDADAETIRAQFSVVVERTVRELRGVSCLDMQEVVPDKQQIMSSRSFGQLVYDLAELEEAVASYVAKAAEKLRHQDSLAGGRTGLYPHQCVQARGAAVSALGDCTAAKCHGRYARSDQMGATGAASYLPSGVWLSQGRHHAVEHRSCG